MSAPLFKPFRALGYITENVPFAVSRRGKETYVVVSVGKTWQVRSQWDVFACRPPQEKNPSSVRCAYSQKLAAVGHTETNSLLYQLYAGLQLQQAYLSARGPSGKAEGCCWAAHKGSTRLAAGWATLHVLKEHPSSMYMMMCIDS